MEYKNLENVEIGVLTKAFNEGFSDYSLKMNLQPEEMKAVLTRRGFNPQVSAGAFDGGELIGFAYNGLRNKVMYDAGTAVLPSFRGRGVASGLFSKVLEFAARANVNEYLLEVLQENEKALGLYKGLGFEVKRRFSCLASDSKSFSNFNFDGVEEFSTLNFFDKNLFWDFEPSWQNSSESVNAGNLEFFASFDHSHDLNAYAAVDLKKGDIAQIAVRQDCRGQALGKKLLAKVATCTTSNVLKVINVEEDSFTDTWLRNLGFECMAKQFEMHCKLS